MKRALILLGMLAASAAGTTIVYAQSLPPQTLQPLERGIVAVSDVMRGDAGPLDSGPPAYSLVEERGALPPRAIAALLDDEGFSILSPPIRRGPAYVVAVIDPSGDDGRVTVDAFNGRIIRFRPVMGPNAMILPDDIRDSYARRDLTPPRNIPNVRPRPAPPVASRTPSPTQATAQPGNSAPRALARPSPSAASAQAALPPASKPSVTLQPTQAMPPAMGFD